MTKDQEIDLIARFVAELPRGSYLADLLAEIPTECAALIRSDIAIPLTVRRGWDERIILQQQNRELDEQLRQKRAELAKIERQTARARDELDNIRSAALTLARA